MNNLLLLTLLMFGLQSFGQQDPNAVLASTYFKEAELAAKNQRLWLANVFGPTLFVDPSTRITYANQADSAGLFKPISGIYSGLLPKQVLIANTAIDWGGKRWSVVQWPLPTNKEDRVSLILHESFHRIQRSLGIADKSPTADHLSTLEGRIYFLLELQALKQAVVKPIEDRVKDLQSALAFRNKRKQLFADTYTAENELEMNEGLAEFTGLILGRKPENIASLLIMRVDSAGNRKSLIRSAPYLTGALYGYLLYQKDKRWTRLLDTASGFSKLVEKVYRFTTESQLSDQALKELEQVYDEHGIIPSETRKEKDRLRLRDNYTTLFTKQPVLILKLIKAGINFDPNTVFNLGNYGNVYPTGEIRDQWGSVKVSSGGMLLRDWQVITLSMDGFSTSSTGLSGNGWELTLKEGWQLVKLDELHYEIVKK